MENLQELGYEVVRIGCNGFMSQVCAVMSAARVNFSSTNEQKHNVCKSCKIAQATLTRGLKSKKIFLEDILTVSETNEVEVLLRNIDLSNWQEFEIDGVPIGKYASYEFLLEHKIDPTKLDINNWLQYVTHLRYCVVVYFGTKKLIQIEKPDVAVVYNYLYSINHAFESAMTKQGIPTYSIHGGMDFRYIEETLSVSQSVAVILRASRSESWSKARTVSLNKDEISQVYKNQKFLLKGKSFGTYSRAVTKKDKAKIRKEYNIGDEQKVIVCATSSPDEMAAAALVVNDLTSSTITRSIYVDQIEWLKDVIDIATRRPDYFILIRIHPREFPNKRDNIKSEHAQKLESSLINLPQNVQVVWPIRNESIYDLMKITQLLLTGISSVGGEFLALGIPVICHESEKLNAYPSECIKSLSNRESYEDLIDSTLGENVDFEKILCYFRWKNFQFRHMSTVRPTKIIARRVWQIGRNVYYLSRLRFLNNLTFLADLGIALFRYGNRLDFKETNRVDFVIKKSLKSLMEISPSGGVDISDGVTEFSQAYRSVNRLRKTLGLNALS